MPYRFSPCCCGCVIVEDDFERTNSGTVGNGWTEYTDGTWSISGGQLVSTSGGSTNRYVYRDAGQLPIQVHAKLDWSAAAEGDKLIIVLNRINDSQYHAIEIEFLKTTLSSPDPPGDFYYLKIEYRKYDYGSTLLAYFYSCLGFGSDMDIFACSTGSRLSLFLTDAANYDSYSWTDYTPLTDGGGDPGTEAGIGFQVGQISYDEVNIYRHRDTPDWRLAADCPHCGSGCPGAQDPVVEYVVDLGAGGLTGSANCEAFAGEFAVRNHYQAAPIWCRAVNTTINGCVWGYYTVSPYINIIMQILGTASACYVRVTVYYSPTVTNYAIYESATFDTADDGENAILDAIPLTLDLVSQTWSDCGGSLPASITLEAA